MFLRTVLSSVLYFLEDSKALNLAIYISSVIFILSFFANMYIQSNGGLHYEEKSKAVIERAYANDKNSGK